MKFNKELLYFDGKITHSSLLKYCDEYFVMSALMYFWPERYFKLQHSDKPDLQIKNEIGIEVTRGTDPKQSKAINEWCNCRAGVNGKSYKKCKEIVEKEYGGKLTDIGIEHPSKDNEEQFSPIKCVINKKFLKLKNYRNNFKECELAVILEEPLPDILEETVAYFRYKQKNDVIKFDNLIIVCNRFIINNGKIFKVSEEENTYFQLIGIKLAKGEVTDIKECFIVE